MIDLGAGSDEGYGGAGRDTVFGGRRADYVSGGPGADLLFGDGGSDWLVGDAGDDTINGGEGADLLGGAAGSDVLNGGKGADTFIVERWGAGLDLIVDFEPGVDEIDVVDFRFASQDAVLSLAIQTGDDVLIRLSGSVSVRLLDTQLEDLRPSDFLIESAF